VFVAEGEVLVNAVADGLDAATDPTIGFPPVGARDAQPADRRDLRLAAVDVRAIGCLFCINYVPY
jgi:hypothetical protein